MRALFVLLVLTSSLWARAEESGAMRPFRAPDKPHTALDDVKSVPAGLIVASADGLRRGDAQLTPINLDGPILGLIVSPDRMEVAALGDGRMLRSHDGGRTFVARPLPEQATCYAGAFQGQDLFIFSDKGRGFVVRASGESEPLNLPAAATWYGAAFRDGLHGGVVGTKAMLVTADGGVSWAQRPAPDGAQSVAYLGAAMFVTGSKGIFRSDDDGATFVNVFQPRMGCVRMDARDGLLAAACKSDAPDFSNAFAYSTDGRTFLRSRSSHMPFAMSVTVEPGGRLAGVGANPVVVEGSPEKMAIVYESRMAQWQRASSVHPKDNVVFPSVMEGSGASDRAAFVPLTPDQQQAFLARHVTPLPSTGSFEAIAKAVFLAAEVDLYTVRQTAAPLELKDCTDASAMWKQCFDEIARRSETRWSYDPDFVAWRFESTASVNAPDAGSEFRKR